MSCPCDNQSDANGGQPDQSAAKREASREVGPEPSRLDATEHDEICDKDGDSKLGLEDDGSYPAPMGSIERTKHSSLHQEMEALAEEKVELMAVLDKERCRLNDAKKLHSDLLKELRDAESQLAEKKASETKGLQEAEKTRERIKSLEQEVAKTSTELKNLEGQIVDCDKRVHAETRRRRKAEEEKEKLEQKLQIRRGSMEERQRELDADLKTLELEKARCHSLATERMALEASLKEKDENIRHTSTSVILDKKQADMTKRRFLKKKQASASTKDVIPQLEAKLVELQHAQGLFEEENKNQLHIIDEMKEEVDLEMVRFLKQGNVEQQTQNELNDMVKAVEEKETEIANCRTEERRQSKILSIMGVQRDMTMREVRRHTQTGKEVEDEVRLKRLIAKDLTTKLNETKARIREFSALINTIKTERNDYVGIIQASIGAIADMKKKIDVLQSEMEKLHAENEEKSKVLSKEYDMHEASQCNRAKLRAERNKVKSRYRDKQQNVERQLVQIGKMHSTINSIERETSRLVSHNARMSDAKSIMSSQLEERVRELDILHRKASLYEQTLKQGERLLQQRKEEIRLLTLKLSDAQRHNETTKNNLPDNWELKEEILQLQQDLASEKATTKELCSNLEDPQNCSRWRDLVGDDPDEEQLAAKVAILDQRLSENKATLLEKELILEELCEVTGKLELKASHENKRTKALVQKMNDVQGRHHSLTRSMMALVSELSMYQATAFRLEEEKATEEESLRQATELWEKGLPPCDEARRDFLRAKCERNSSCPEKKHLTEQGGKFPDPRPTSYLEDTKNKEIIPKPYGAMAPFKASEPGSTMRHIRAPVAPKLVI